MAHETNRQNLNNIYYVNFYLGNNITMSIRAFLKEKRKHFLEKILIVHYLLVNRQELTYHTKFQCLPALLQHHSREASWVEMHSVI